MTTILEPVWAGETAVLVASGPSLCPSDVDRVRGRARVIAVNDGYRLAPWADVLYACDRRWWEWNKGVPGFAGRKLSLHRTKYPDVECLRNTGGDGLETVHRDGVRTGKNSGYQAMGVAVHLGVRRIVLLGYDMQGDHFFGSHANRSRPPFDQCLPKFQTLVEPLRRAGIEVVNCTRTTALHAFPKARIEDVFATIPVDHVA
jgi:hypothetical protein